MSGPWERRLGTARTALFAVFVAAIALGLVARWRTLRTPAATNARPALSIAAASDLRFALDDLVAAYKQSHAVAIATTYGSSGTLTMQIVHGAPFDLLLSADRQYPQELASNGLTVAFTEFTYAAGRLALWVPRASPLDIEHTGLAALTSPGVAHVAIANPEHAPYGRAAAEALRASHMYDAVARKLVLGENVAQALQFVQSGAADAGIIALSLATAPQAASAGRYSIVPADLHAPLDQVGVILRTSHVEQARAFRAFLLSDPARAVLQHYGFTVPAQS